MRFQVASLYPLLYRLERRGWIVGHWVEKRANDGAAITILTRDGRRVLSEQRRGWRRFVAAIAASRSGACMTGKPRFVGDSRRAPDRSDAPHQRDRRLGQHLEDRRRSLVASGLSEAGGAERPARARRKRRPARRAVARRAPGARRPAGRRRAGAGHFLGAPRRISATPHERSGCSPRSR